MELTNEEIKLLKILAVAENGETSIKDIIGEVDTKNIENLEQKGLIKKTFSGEHYYQDKYKIIGINDRWRECLKELFRKLN